MSSSRAALTLAPIPRPNDLAAAREPLASRFPVPGDGETEPPAPLASRRPVVDEAADAFPAPKVRERVTFVSMRVPNSLLDQVEAICKERGIDRTALILHYVRQGVRTRVSQP